VNRLNGFSEVPARTPAGAARSGRPGQFLGAASVFMSRLLALCLPMLAASVLAQHAATPASAAHAGARGLAVVGIVDGPAVLLRQTTRYSLVEGVRLQPDDIVEAPKGGVVQIEFADGSQLALADGGRVMLQPHWMQKRGNPTPAPRAYLLQGWFKLSESVNATGDFSTPGWHITHDSSDAKGHPVPASVVFTLADAASEGAPALIAFIEAGSFKITERAEPHRNWVLKPDDYFALHGADRPTLLRKPAGDFLQQMPAPFRDALPSRASRYADKPVPPLPQGDVTYADVAPWLHGEAAMRPLLLERWRSRTGDPAFRSALQGNLALHPEWERVLNPERASTRHNNPASR
jgi:hypothetical protein